MTYLILAAGLLIFIVITLIVVFVKRRPLMEELLTSPEPAIEDAVAQLPFDASQPLQSTYRPEDSKYEPSILNQDFQQHTGGEAKQVAENTFDSTRETAMSGSSLSQNLQTRNPLYDLEKDYERGMQANYDEYIGAMQLVITHVVMKTSADVDIAFQICMRKIQTALQQRGLERAPLLIDIAGLVIGGDATTAWGQSVKTCWDQVCVKGENDLYIAAHYNSQASPPGEEQLQEKTRRIQLMTSAVLNNFQSNIFDTREEAVVFLQRLRELARTGRR